jgi:ubiquinone/menaquinone biosynthesis C-methylase UbiE
MEQQNYGTAYKATAADNYQRYFVPAIGRPVALDLIEAADLQPGDRVLDVACGTGVVTRMAAEKVGATGTVAGLDLTPGMLESAKAATPADLDIDWYEAPAEAIPLDSNSFDVVLCQMGVQFFSDAIAALAEMRRVMRPGGRTLFTLPGPIPAPFQVLERALSRYVGPQPAKFTSLVFSLHDSDEVRGLAGAAGFADVEVGSRLKRLELPPPSEFLWQYAYSTPIAAGLEKVDQDRRNALETDVTERWQEDFTEDGKLVLNVTMTTVTARN